jgi:predicted DNA-binding transcriptional regulator AlpA
MANETEADSKVDLILTRPEVAQRLRISVRTLSRMENRGDLTGRIRISDRIFGYRNSAIERFLANRTGLAS